MGARAAPFRPADNPSTAYRKPTRKERAGFIASARSKLLKLESILSPSGGEPDEPAVRQLRQESALVMRCISLTNTALPELSRLPRRLSGRRDEDPRLVALLREVSWAQRGCPAGRTFLAFFRAHCPCLALTHQEAQTLSPALIYILLSEILNELSGRESVSSARVAELLTAVRSLILNVKFAEIAFELLSYEPILAADPARIFGSMEATSRRAYRRAVCRIAHQSGCSADQVAEAALILSRERQRLSEADAHIGHYLIGRGKHLLFDRCGARRRALLHRVVARPYAVAKSIACGEIALCVLATVLFWTFIGHVSAAFPFRICLIALFGGLAFSSATQLMGIFSSLASGAHALPCIKVAPNTSPELRCVIAVPALLFSREQIDRLVQNLERHFLNGNSSFCAALTDFPDATTPGVSPAEAGLLNHMKERLRTLNQKYSAVSSEPFVLLHRDRVWCEEQGVWMGWERKRGKVLALMELMSGGESKFSVQEGAVKRLLSAPYLMILDEDSQLTHGCLAQLMGCLAHPLNTADSVAGCEQKRYSLAQPLSAVAVETAAHWRLQELFLPPVADAQKIKIEAPPHPTQHGLFGEAVFTGKGLVHVPTTFARLDSAVPANRILSHDIVEGGLAKTMQVNEALLLESAPSSYALLTKRQHRWMRGDWQNLWWLAGTLYRWRCSIPARIGFLACWHICKNALHSLADIGLCLLLASATLLPPGAALSLMVALYVALTLASYVSFTIGACRGLSTYPPGEIAQFVRGRLLLLHTRVLLKVCFCFSNAALSADAIARTVWRVALRRKLLEWESMAAAELSQASVNNRANRLNAIRSLALIVLIVLAVVFTSAGKLLSPLFVAWLCSPWIARHLTRDPRGTGDPATG